MVAEIAPFVFRNTSHALITSDISAEGFFLFQSCYSWHSEIKNNCVGCVTSWMIVSKDCMISSRILGYSSFRTIVSVGGSVFHFWVRCSIMTADRRRYEYAILGHSLIQLIQSPISMVLTILQRWWDAEQIQTKTTNITTNLETGWSACILREWCSNPWHDGTWRGPETNLDPADYACIGIQCTHSSNEFHRHRCCSRRKQKNWWLQRQRCAQHLQGMMYSSCSFRQLRSVYTENNVQTCV